MNSLAGGQARIQEHQDELASRRPGADPEAPKALWQRGKLLLQVSGDKFLEFYSLKSTSLGFWIIQTGIFYICPNHFPDLNFIINLDPRALRS